MINKFYRNFKTMLAHPDLIVPYCRWQFDTYMAEPSLCLPYGNKVYGFNTFSEFIGTKKGIPSHAELAILSKFITSESVVFDVGANIGVFTLLFVSLAKQVYSFEPDRVTFLQLNHNVQRNNILNAITLNMAVGVANELGSFTVNRNSFATSHLSNKIMKEGDVNIKVQIVSIDSFCEKENIDEIHFLKIDVEGAEPQVLYGARKMLKAKKINFIFIEICPNNLENFGYTTDNIYDYLVENGYFLFNASSLKRISKSEMKNIGLENLIATYNDL